MRCSRTTALVFAAPAPEHLPRWNQENPQPDGHACPLKMVDHGTPPGFLHEVTVAVTTDAKRAATGSCPRGGAAARELVAGGQESGALQALDPAPDIRRTAGPGAGRPWARRRVWASIVPLDSGSLDLCRHEVHASRSAARRRDGDEPIEAADP